MNHLVTSRPIETDFLNNQQQKQNIEKVLIVVRLKLIELLVMRNRDRILSLIY